jgi:hypothetical protein
MSCGSRILYEWQFNRYVCRVAESEPGIVHFEQATNDGEFLHWRFEPTETPMGAANEIIQLSMALAEAQDALRQTAEIVLAANAGEPREAIWSLLKNFERLSSQNAAVRLATRRR